MPSKWISLSHFKRTFVDLNNEHRIVDCLIEMAACGDLEVRAGVWVKTHYEIIEDYSLENCLQQLMHLESKDKICIFEQYKPKSRSMQHIRLGVGYLSVHNAGGIISVLADVTERFPLQIVEASPAYWKDAFIDMECDNIVFMDRKNLQRTVASQIDLNWADVKKKFEDFSLSKTPIKFGRPRKYYNDDMINATWKQYCSKNPQLSLEEKYKHLRSLYREKNLPVSKDPYFQPEARLKLFLELGSQVVMGS